MSHSVLSRFQLAGIAVASLTLAATAPRAQGQLGAFPNPVKEAIDNGKKTIGDGVDRARRGVQNGARQTQRQGQRAYDSARGAANRGVNSARSGGQSLYNNSRRQLGNAGRSLGNAYNSGRNNLGNAGRSLGNAYNRGSNSLGNAGRSLGNAGRSLGNAGQTFGNSLNRGANSIGNTGQQWGNSLSRGGQGLRNSTNSGLGNLFNGGRNAGGNASNLSPGGLFRQPTRNTLPQTPSWGNVRSNSVPNVSNSVRSGVRSSTNYVRNAVPSSPPPVVRNVLPKNVISRQDVGNAGATLGNRVRSVAGNAAVGTKKTVTVAIEGAKDTGKAVVATGSQAVKVAGQGAKQAGLAATRTAEDVFSGTHQILDGAATHGGRFAKQAGAATGATLEAGLIGFGRTVQTGVGVVEQGAQQLQHADDFVNQVEQKYLDAKNTADTLKHGDRGEVLTAFEDASGIEVRDDVKQAILETDLNSGVELVENATGLDLENVKQRVDQGQALADAARSGKLSNVTEAAGAKSNRSDVRAEKEAGWDSTAWGNEIDHEEYAKMAGALGSSVATGNAGPFIVYAKQWAADQYKTLSEQLIEQGKAGIAAKLNEQMLIDSLRGAMNGEPAKLAIDGATIDVGVATYNHRLEVSGGVPEVTKGGIQINQVGTSTKLPNTHQPYVRMKFND